MKLKSITIEGMHSVVEKTYTFNDLNYLFGNNGAGKSTALQAIQLALLGYIPGTSKTSAAIYRHARRKAMSVTAVLSRESENLEDVTITRTWAGSGKSVNSSVTVTPEGYDIQKIVSELELPIFNFNEFVGMTSNKLKDWFIEFLPKASGEIEWETVLKDALGDKHIIDEELLPSTLRTIQSFESDGLSGVDLVRRLNDHFKEEMSYQKGQLTKLQATVQSLVFYDECDSVEDVEELKMKVQDLQNLRIALDRYLRVEESNKKLIDMYNSIELGSDCIETDSEYLELTNKINEDSKKVEDFSKKIKELSTEINTLMVEANAKKSIASGSGVCPYTSKVCDSMTDLISQYKDEVEELSKSIEDLNSQRLELVHSKQSIDNRIQECDNLRINVENAYARKAGLKSQMCEGLECPTTMTDVEISKEIESLTDTIIKAEANKRYNELINDLTADKYKIEDTIEVIKVWSKLTDANGLQTTMMTKPFEDLAEGMDKCLHVMFGDTTIRTSFNLSEKANSFSFGITRNDKYIPFDLLSSGEKCLYTIAMMICLLANSETPLKLIMIDDLLDHLDDNNAAYLFKALAKVKDVQFVLAGVKECNVTGSENIVIEVK